jgi:peptidoglycan hydrolase-like protein with peptidoglycan-binding domain
MTSTTRACAISMAAFLLGGGAIGCGHTHTARDTGAATAAKKEDPPAKDDGRHGATRADHPTGVTLKSDTRAGAPPLATSPAGLLKPEAVEAIQGKLASRGALAKDDRSGKLDDPTRKALRAFQRDNNLPATGMPDDLTVKKLGLDPGQIFRATPRGAGHPP